MQIHSTHNTRGRWREEGEEEQEQEQEQEQEEVWSRDCGAKQAGLEPWCAFGWVGRDERMAVGVARVWCSG